ncbi:hypothetical protein GO755_12280 [Spirosoma sp. HMF4905]|uniref:Uncharacterized protein n=1 Tax=Spirosoma arboris TaxID=2682092 RepID=A0A7K1SAK0_9BACT|nr:hypothetical protein [Spirosoma arboris]MVM30810.1 hypothetical protein [Spirosoma arboris]
MNYKLTTTLKKADTEGRIPAYTLDQYIRSELSQQLINQLIPHLSIARTDNPANTNQEIVEFSTELILLKSHQWQQVKQSLTGALESLSPDQQISLQKLILEVDQG